MPKISTAEGSEGEVLVVVATRKSGRTVSASNVAAAGAASSSKRATSTKKIKVSAQEYPHSPAKAGSKKSKEAIQATLETLEERTMDKSWYDVLVSEFTQPYFKKVPFPACLCYYLADAL